MDHFIISKNIENFELKLKQTSDDEERRVLLALLAAEQDKLLGLTSQSHDPETFHSAQVPYPQDKAPVQAALSTGIVPRVL
ncbi:MAG: hypothetical protein ACK4QP_02635 [Pseudorhizobium sp.]